MSPSQTRVWMAPLMLVFLVAMIYLLSLMPPQPPYNRNTLEANEEPSKDFALKGQMHVEWNENRKTYHVKWKDVGFRKGIDEESSCENGGIPNHINSTCICPRLFVGERCQIPICMNGGSYNETSEKCDCIDSWVGDHCLYKCVINNQTTGSCECAPGKPCIVHKCINGHLIDGRCVCFEGFIGSGCAVCDETFNGVFCDERFTISGMRRRGAVNSRLTLSGLSFCAITIGLLCVAASRRRTSPSMSSEETWYRVFHPTQTRGNASRCRHDYFCGGLWMPRDRAIVVAPGRVSISNARTSAGRRSQRTTTPPPSYTTVDNRNAVEEVMPPTYEEATRIFIEDEERPIDTTMTTTTTQMVKEEDSLTADVVEEATTTSNQSTI